MPATAFLRADWPAPAGIRALTTLRSGPGVSLAPFDRFNLGLRSGDEPAHALANRQRLVEALALPAAPRWLQQVHGLHVLRFDRGENEFSPGLAAGDADEPIADASVTSSAGVVLAVLTADCLPVLLCSRDGRHIGAAHAGWRGLSAGVLEATVASMPVPPAQLLAWLGPAAGPQAYEIGEEVRQAFLDIDPAADAAFVPTRENHWCVDLYRLARQRLASAGVDAVYGGGLCTISDPQRFYSHRRDQRTGRLASLIWREA
jgi:polyphenol oxidase